MSNVKKYYRYVVDDLMKNVEQGEDRFGNGFFTLFDSYLVKDTPFKLTSFYPNYKDIFFSFGDILNSRYGIHSDEVNIVWGLFKVKMNKRFYKSSDGSI